MSEQPECYYFAGEVGLDFRGGNYDGLIIFRNAAPRWVQLLPESQMPTPNEESTDGVRVVAIEEPEEEWRKEGDVYQRRITPSGPMIYDNLQ